MPQLSCAIILHGPYYSTFLFIFCQRETITSENLRLGRSPTVFIAPAMNFRAAAPFLVASLASSHAFSSSSHFTWRLPSSPVGSNGVSFSSRSSTVVLSMDLFDRFQRVATSNIDGAPDSSEDPEKIMSQALKDMQVRLFRGGLTRMDRYYHKQQHIIHCPLNMYWSPPAVRTI